MFDTSLPRQPNRAQRRQRNTDGRKIRARIRPDRQEEQLWLAQQLIVPEVGDGRFDFARPVAIHRPDLSLVFAFHEDNLEIAYDRVSRPARLTRREHTSAVVDQPSAATATCYAGFP